MANTKVKFRKVNVKSLVQQIEGREPPYPVYRFGKVIKTERPEVPGKTYRWAKDLV